MVRERFAAHVRSAFITRINAKKTSLFTFKKKLSLGDDVGSHDVVLVLGEARLTWHCPRALDCHLPKNTKAPDKLIPRLMVINKHRPSARANLHRGESQISRIPRGIDGHNDHALSP